MLNQSSHGKVNYPVPKKVLHLLVIAGLMAFPTISVGQVLVGSKSGSDHHPNTIAMSLGWAKYDMGMSNVLINGRASSFKFCSIKILSGLTNTEISSGSRLRSRMNTMLNLVDGLGMYS